MTDKRGDISSKLKQQLYSSVYTSQGTIEQLLAEQTIQALIRSFEEKHENRELQEENMELQMKLHEKESELHEKNMELQMKLHEELELHEKLLELHEENMELQMKLHEELELHEESELHKNMKLKMKKSELQMKLELHEKNMELQMKLHEELELHEESELHKNMKLKMKKSELQMKLELHEKNMELQMKKSELHEKNMELQMKLHEEWELRKKNLPAKLHKKERELCQSQNAVRIYQQQVSTDDHWVINTDEVILTEEELGRGSYAVINIGTFRGLKVAVKSLHTIIISDYNLALFSREMSIASRVRHPNLVQFIGATKVGNPLILTELMSTSLHKELQKNQLTKQQILSIAQDVALGLNYLHLFKPQPIIHRDVSSPNVLLDPSASEAGYKAKLGGYGTAKIQECNQAYAAPEAHDPDQHSPAMDVYSYSVLLMEMNLGTPPEMTIIEREQKSDNFCWSPMKSLIQGGLNTTRQDRPTMSQVIESLREIKV